MDMVMLDVWWWTGFLAMSLTTFASLIVALTLAAYVTYYTLLPDATEYVWEADLIPFIMFFVGSVMVAFVALTVLEFMGGFEVWKGIIQWIVKPR